MFPSDQFVDPIEPFEKSGQPLLSPGATFPRQRMHLCQLTGAPGDDAHGGLKASKVQLTDNAVVSVSYQKHARARLQLLLDEFEFPFAQAKTAYVVALVGIGIGKEHLGGRLFDDGSADGTAKHIGWALRGKTHRSVELAPSLRSVLGEFLKRIVSQQTPKLVHPAHQATSVQESPHQMEQ